MDYSFARMNLLRVTVQTYSQLGTSNINEETFLISVPPSVSSELIKDAVRDHVRKVGLIISNDIKITGDPNFGTVLGFQNISIAQADEVREGCRG